MQNKLPVLAQHHFSVINASGTTFTVPKFSNKMRCPLNTPLLSQTLNSVCHTCTINRDGSVVKVFFCTCTRSLGANHFTYSTNFTLADFIASKNMTTYLQKQLEQGEEKNKTKPSTSHIVSSIHTLRSSNHPTQISPLSLSFHTSRANQTHKTHSPARSVRG